MSELHCTTRPELGFGGVSDSASARALRHLLAAGLEYFYNQCLQVQNLIGMSVAMIEVSIDKKKEAS